MKIWRSLFAVLPGIWLLQVPAMAVGAPSLSAASAVLMDAESGRILYEKDAHTKRSIASTTKLMTALVVMDWCMDLSESVEILEEDTRTEGSSMYLHAGEQVTVEELLYGLLLQSGNDAALALARHFGGSVAAFADLMNEKAVSLGMEESYFCNPNGLESEGHYSTAADMAKLGAACMENETIAKIVATPSITIGDRSFQNHNKLLRLYEGCVGMKTGYTEAAGRTLVSAARRDGQLLICVTLNAPDDWNDHMALFTYGFSSFPRQVLARAGERVGLLPVTGGLVPAVEVETVKEIAYPLAEGETVHMELVLPRAAAPIEQEAPAGELVYYLEGTEIGRVRLSYSASVQNNIAPPSFLARIRHWLLGEDGQ